MSQYRIVFQWHSLYSSWQKWLCRLRKHWQPSICLVTPSDLLQAIVWLIRQAGCGGLQEADDSPCNSSSVPCWLVWSMELPFTFRCSINIAMSKRQRREEVSERVMERAFPSLQSVGWVHVFFFSLWVWVTISRLSLCSSAIFTRQVKVLSCIGSFIRSFLITVHSWFIYYLSILVLKSFPGDKTVTERTPKKCANRNSLVSGGDILVWR